MRLRGQALTSHPTLRRAVACGRLQDSMPSAEKGCSTSSVVLARRAGRPWVVAMVTGKIDQRPVVDDVALGILAADRGLHPVIEDLARHAVERGEGGEVAAQHRLQVLVQDEAGPEQAAVAEHQGE